MTTILDEILDHKRVEVAAARETTPDAELAAAAAAIDRQPRGFRRALVESEPPRVIAEIKRRSPSKGEIRADFDPLAIARAFEQGGAAALSVLTDEHFFGGSLDVLRAVREVTALPLLRKDFVVDPYQIDEAWVAGADAVLLIVRALEPAELPRLQEHARALGLDVLVEVDDEAGLERAAAAGADLIGVNNRDLARFVTDLAVTERLAPKVPEDAVLVAESGIFGFEDVDRLTEAGAQAFLVGESLMREPDVAAALGRLRGIS
ncbi:MAG: indole-3-glycerol phosphate synthase [Deltaproteobacteria bacterium]|jgi:indole-3-glycerol phosphate synthase|nr:indole-3-glycerol phosphate synthase [Deltaproteobacteria bacterium]